MSGLQLLVYPEGDTLLRPSLNDAPLDVLVAEDSVDDRLLLSLAAKETMAQTRLSFVSDGAALLIELVERIERRNPPDVVLLDLRMPGINGHAVLDMAQCNPQLALIPIVAFSSSFAEQDITRCYERGVVGYITKPSKFDDLVHVLESLHDLLS